LNKYIGCDLRSLLYPEAGQEQVAAEQLKQTQYTQPALFALEYALSVLWKHWGIYPNAMIGHSIGEFVAAHLAGVFSLEQALMLVAARGRLMQKMEPGAMLAVSSTEEKLASFLNPGLNLAVINAANACVISGTFSAIAELEKQLAAKRIIAKRLQTSHAFHSYMMDPALPLFRQELEKVAWNKPTIPYISNVTGTWIDPDQAMKPEYWLTQLRSTVRFDPGLKELLQKSNVLIETGPGRTLTALAKRHPAKTEQHSILQSLPQALEDEDDHKVMLESLAHAWLAGCTVVWKNLYEK